MPDYIEELYEGQVAQQVLIDTLFQRMDRLVADYQQAAHDAEQALALIPDLASKISDLREAVNNAPSGTVPQEVQDAADALESASQTALEQANAALAEPTPPPSDQPAPDQPPVDQPVPDAPVPDQPPVEAPADVILDPTTDNPTGDPVDPTSAQADPNVDPATDSTPDNTPNDPPVADTPTV